MEETERLTQLPRGVMGRDYHHERLSSPGPRYRLKRRGLEAARILSQYAVPNPKILDLGTADGLMLDYVSDLVKPRLAIGLDLSVELLQINTRRNPVVLADGETLPFAPDEFDAVIATAIIEHVPHPERFVAEIYRVLKPAGVCMITTPVPLFEELATKFGFLQEDDHQETFTLKKASSLLIAHGFGLLESEKFMMSPVGFPAEQKLEKLMKKVGLSSLLLNQLVAARKM